MALFVEVNSLDKGCKVIINLDSVVEIAPLSVGGCVLFVADSAATGGKTPLKVSDSYNLFKQFAMQTVSADDIAARFPPTRGRGRPPKVDAGGVAGSNNPVPSGTGVQDGGYVGGEHPGASF